LKKPDNRARHVESAEKAQAQGARREAPFQKKRCHLEWSDGSSTTGAESKDLQLLPFLYRRVSDSNPSRQKKGSDWRPFDKMTAFWKAPPAAIQLGLQTTKSPVK